MKITREQFNAPSPSHPRISHECGFALAEFLISTVIVLALSAGVFSMLTDVQRTSGYQTEVLNVMENTRVAMSTLERYIVQAGNDPRATGFVPITITGTSQVQLCTDLTGSAGGSQGDPDGDILDAEEDVTVQYNENGQTIELVAGDDPAQTVARYIAGLTLEYFDKNGATTAVATDVSKIRVTVTGTSNLRDPRTNKPFGYVLTSDFSLPNRG